MFRRIRYSKYAEPSLSGMTLRPSIESIIMRYTSVGLTSFLVALLAFSIFAPVQTTDATGELLVAYQSDAGSISVATSNASGDDAPISMGLSAGSAGAVRTAYDDVTVTATGNSGYQLYISTVGANNALIRDGATSTGTDANTGAPTYAEADTIPSTLTTDIASPAVLSNDTWGFAVASTNSASDSGSEDVVATGFGSASSYPVGDSSSPNSTFIAVPTRGNDLLVAERENVTGSNGVRTRFYYGTRITSAKASGLYKNTITYTAISNTGGSALASVSPNRTNQLGGGQTLTIATPSTTALASVGAVTVTVGGNICANATPIQAGDGISVNVTCTSPALATGWHEVIVNFANSGETYVVNPGIEYYLDEGGSQVATYMQDFTVTDCANMASLSSITLQDNRDNNIYRITKQADGNCWMTENLRLGNNPNNDGTISSDITLNSSNSDIPKGGNSFTIHASDIQTTIGTDWSNGSFDVSRVYSFVNNNDVSAENKKAYGNLYNWYTATASSGTTSVIGGADASASICPKGWKLPSRSGNGSYTTLMQTQIPDIPDGSGESATGQVYTSQFIKAPLYFALAGGYDSTGLYGLDHIGYYWSRTSRGTSIAEYFSFNMKGYFGLHYGFTRYSGIAVRCVFIPTMQDFSAVACANLNTAQTVTLTDARDQNEYSVTKQADGNCWMTQNLRLGTTRDGTSTQNVTLTTKNSDLPTGSADYTISTSDIQTSGTNSWGTDETRVYSFANTANATTYGNLYNWYTATARTGTSSVTSSDANGSICPKGWKLPPNTGNGSYTNLMQNTPTTSSISTAISGTNIPSYTDALQQTPLSFVNAGMYVGTSLYYQENRGSYWSRTAGSGGIIFYFNYYTGTSPNNGEFGLQTGDYMIRGMSVRCVYTPTMQDFTTTACSNLKTAQSLTLTDNRDMNDYQVTKQADGNCWMTQNLRLGTTRDGTSTQNVTLTSKDSDITGPDQTLVVLGSGEQLSDRIQTSGSNSWTDPVDAYHVYSFAGTANATTYGNLYNFYTATASSGTTALTDGDAPMSICPFGWKLPPNTGNGSYTKLIQTAIPAIGSVIYDTDTTYTDAMQAVPLSFVYSGRYVSEFGAQGSRSYYWSRTTDLASGAFDLYFYTNGYFRFQNRDFRYYGFAIRCVMVL